ncbi:hypothetical protein [Kitasatospora sp. NPDC001132]
MGTDQPAAGPLRPGWIDGGTDLTQTGVVVGSVPCLSPERAAGQRPGPPADL